MYAVYGGHEYRAAKTSGGGIKLLAENSPPPGFKKTPYGNYTLTVPRGAVSELFIVKSYIYIGGRRYQVEYEKDGYYHYGAPLPAPELESAGRGDYRGSIKGRRRRPGGGGKNACRLTLRPYIIAAYGKSRSGVICYSRPSIVFIMNAGIFSIFFSMSAL